MEHELKPCPFCGGEISVETIDKFSGNPVTWEDGDGDFLFFRCHNCDMEIFIDSPNGVSGIFEIWNNRKSVESTSKVKLCEPELKNIFIRGFCECGMPVSGFYDYCPFCGKKLVWKLEQLE